MQKQQVNATLLGVVINRAPRTGLGNSYYGFAYSSTGAYTSYYGQDAQDGKKKGARKKKAKTSS